MTTPQIAGVVAGAAALVGAVLGLQVSEAVYVYDDQKTALRSSGVVFGAAPARALWDGKARGDAAFAHMVFRHCDAAARGRAGANVEFLTFDRRFSGAPLAALLGNATWRADQRTYRIPRSDFAAITAQRTSDEERAQMIERRALA